jgi:hypothetical protein
VIVGRISRDRTGLRKSFHGNSKNSADDFIVHTEFGADAWSYVMSAGFENVSIHVIEFPAAIAFSAVK